MTITAAADGSALGNPGPAGWGWYVDEDRWACGGWRYGTNNQGELTAVLDLLAQTAHLPDDLVIYCDSQYVINSITKWMAGWKKRGWRKGDGKPVLNLELMQALDARMTARRASGRRVEFRWVKGHAGHPLNEAADRLANGAATAYSRGQEPDAGPGMPGADARADTSFAGGSAGGGAGAVGSSGAVEPAGGSAPQGRARGSRGAHNVGHAGGAGSAAGPSDADGKTPAGPSYPGSEALF